MPFLRECILLKNRTEKFNIYLYIYRERGGGLENEELGFAPLSWANPNSSFLILHSARAAAAGAVIGTRTFLGCACRLCRFA